MLFDETRYKLQNYFLRGIREMHWYLAVRAPWNAQTDRQTPTLKQLHWLPIHARIAFKISLLMYHIYSGTSPSYMSSMVMPCPASRSRGLRSSMRGDFAVICKNLSLAIVLSWLQDLENGTAFQLQIVNAHLLVNFSQN